MFKQVILILMILTTTLYCFAEIGVISSAGKKTTMLRGNKAVKFNVGDFVENNDELSAGADSWLGCKFIEGNSAIRLFSDTKAALISISDSLGQHKKVNLKQGSVLTRILPGSGSLTLLTPNSVVKADSASYLIKITSQGETRVIVLSGGVHVYPTGSEEAEIVAAGNTLIINKYLVSSQRTTFESDFSPEEYAFLDPQPLPEPQNITIPMVGPDGRVKYLDLSW